MNVTMFAGMNEVKMREAGLAALEQCAGSYTDKPAPIVNRLTWEAKLYAALKTEDAPHWNDVVQDHTNYQYQDANFPLPLFWTRWFWSWMEQAGYAVRIVDPIHEGRAPFSTYAITAIGVRRMKSTHPCRPGAMTQLRTDFLADHEDSLNRLEDAFTCFERALYRPAVVMLGLAYEELVTVALVRLGKPTKGQASDKQDALEKVLKNHPATESRRAALCAMNVVDSIRGARNGAAHKAAGAWDAVEVDELLADGLRAYPKLAGYQKP